MSVNDICDSWDVLWQTFMQHLVGARHATKCWGCKDHETHKPQSTVLCWDVQLPILLSSPETAYDLRIIFLGRAGFSVETFIDFDDRRLRTMPSQKGYRSLWKLSSLNCLGEIHLPRVAGLFPLTVFYVSFGFISLFGKDIPLMYFFFCCLFLSAKVVVEIPSGMKEMYTGAVRKLRSWKSPFVLVCPQHHHWIPHSASGQMVWPHIRILR